MADEAQGPADRKPILIREGVYLRQGWNGWDWFYGPLASDGEVVAAVWIRQLANDGRWELWGPQLSGYFRDECIHGCLMVEVLALAEDMLEHPEKLVEQVENE